jgi:hypothetical protein
VSWLTGPAMRRQFAEKVDINWSHAPLRYTLNSLSHSQKVGMLLDRRVDPDQLVDLNLVATPLEDAFRRLASDREQAVSFLDSLVYVGPPEYTANLRTLVALRTEEVRRLPAAKARALLASARLSWPDFAEPRSLLEKLGKESGVEILGVEQIPHDLWAGADLPTMSFAERVTLIVGQFDLTFRVNASGESITLIPVPAHVAVVRGHPGGTHPAELARQWQELLPDCRVELSGDRIVVEARVEEHERLVGASRPKSTGESRVASKGGTSSGRTAKKETRYTLRVARGALGPVMEQLAKQLKLDLKIDEEGLRQAGISLYAEVSFNVENATLDELLKAVLEPVGCTYRRNGEKLEVIAAK